MLIGKRKEVNRGVSQKFNITSLMTSLYNDVFLSIKNVLQLQTRNLKLNLI